MNLARFPRRHHTPAPTPIEFLPHLSAHLGGPELYVKRDDVLGLTGGGNKTRKLEFLIADALEEGADTLLTVGAVQSNHCRLTLAAAVKEGLKCRLVLEERVPNSYDPDARGPSDEHDRRQRERSHHRHQRAGKKRPIGSEAARSGSRGCREPEYPERRTP